MIKFDTKEVLNAARNSAALAQATRFWTARTRFRIGDNAYLLDVKEGQVVRFEEDNGQDEVQITLSASVGCWEKVLQEVPPPGFQDVFFNDGRSDLRIEGNLVRDVTPYAHAINEFLRVLKKVLNATGDCALSPEVDRDFDQAVGRYMYVDIQGIQYRVYYEEAGKGDIPLIVIHTAGTDGRQWRHFLEDADYGKSYRIISIDLPYHGKSLPPPTERWWESPYKLTKDFAMATVLAVSRKLKLDKPVFMGAAIGGMLAVDFAYHHPDEFRAVVAINAGLAVEADLKHLDSVAATSNPRVSSRWNASLMGANTSPTTSEIDLREFKWVYSQTAPTILEGSLYYYLHDHDLTPEQARTIDTKKIDVYLLTGDYDFLAQEWGTAKLAKEVAGCHFQIMPGLGHFGPAENHEGFKAYLLPVLQEIAHKSR